MWEPLSALLVASLTISVTGSLPGCSSEPDTTDDESARSASARLQGEYSSSSSGALAGIYFEGDRYVLIGRNGQRSIGNFTFDDHALRLTDATSGAIASISVATSTLQRFTTPTKVANLRPRTLGSASGNATASEGENGCQNDVFSPPARGADAGGLDWESGVVIANLHPTDLVNSGDAPPLLDTDGGEPLLGDAGALLAASAGLVCAQVEKATGVPVATCCGIARSLIHAVVELIQGGGGGDPLSELLRKGDDLGDLLAGGADGGSMCGGGQCNLDEVTIGAPCSSDHACNHGAPGVGVVCSNTAPAKEHCIEGCHADADCPSGGTCDRSGATWKCTGASTRLGTRCGTDDDVCTGQREGVGRVCSTQSSQCIIGCHADSDCSGHARCDKSRSTWVCSDGKPDPANPTAPTTTPTPSLPSMTKGTGTGPTVGEIADTSCPTVGVITLSRQIAEQMFCLAPNAFVDLRGKPGLSFGDQSIPYLQKPAADALTKVSSNRPVQVNHAMRTLPQQYMVYRQAQTQTCNVARAAPPNNSYHEEGLALDVQNYEEVIGPLRAAGWSYPGFANDPVHFEMRLDATYAGLGARAFQTLWNRNHPEDPIPVDGQYNASVESRLRKSPAQGFTKGAECQGRSSEATRAPAPSPTPATAPGGGSAFCAYSWEERPGYSDYTTIDWYARSVGQTSQASFDRAEAATLQGSGALGSGDLCKNARILKPCFDKEIAMDANTQAGKTFVNWCSKRGLDPVRVKMAFSYQETLLGKLHDNCSGGSCNGIGIAQIISAYDANLAPIGNSDRRWEGITHNVLTNLTFGTRVLAEKIQTNQSDTLVTLARAYNGNPDASIRIPYGTKVNGFYTELGSCGIF